MQGHCCRKLGICKIFSFKAFPFYAKTFPKYSRIVRKSSWLVLYMCIHDFDRLYFIYPGFVLIKLDIPVKPVHLPFDWCRICYYCFTGVCRVSKFRAMSKRKSCKIDRIVWKMCAMSCFVLCFCEQMHVYRSLYQNSPKQNVMLNFK